MVECASCGDFTDNPVDGKYSYCDDCLAEFDEIRNDGVIVQQEQGRAGYQVFATARRSDHEGGFESDQIAALARGKHLAEKIGCRAIFEYKASGSTWILEEYLQYHPDIRRDVRNRLSRVPKKSDGGLLNRIRKFL